MSLTSITVRIKGADLRVLSALIDVIAECTGSKLEAYKPRFSRVAEIRIEGSSESVERAKNMLAKFSATAGWRFL